MNKIFVNNELRDADIASVSVNDSGFLYGVGLFETMRAKNGVVFAFDEHMDRLTASATALGIPGTYDNKYISDAVYKTLKANGLESARIRLTLTSGTMTPGEGEPKGTLVVSAGEFESYPAKTYEEGATVILSSYRQNPMDPTTGHQVLNYLPRLLALSAARAKLGIESLWFTTANVLAEGCFSNVFIVKDEKVMTPALDTPVVPGIVRKHVCKLAAGQGLEVIEGELLISDLLGAQEVFLTSTVMGVLPVVKIEAHTVGAGKPGPVTKKLSQSFDEYFDKSCKRQNLQ